MGTWGPGIFDNDAARDHLFEVTRQLADQIDQALTDAVSFELAGKGSDAELAEAMETVLPNIEIMCVLHESLGGGYLPEPETADAWQSQFEQLAAEGSSDRREVVHSTFERLRRLAQQCWEE